MVLATFNHCYRQSTCASTGYGYHGLFVDHKYLLAQLSPDYIGVELGIGESLLIKAITDSTGRSGVQVKADLKKEGDLGLVAMVCAQTPTSTVI